MYDTEYEEGWTEDLWKYERLLRQALQDQDQLEEQYINALNNRVFATNSAVRFLSWAAVQIYSRKLDQNTDFIAFLHQYTVE